MRSTLTDNVHDLLAGTATASDAAVTIRDADAFRREPIDDLVTHAVFHTDDAVRRQCRRIIRLAARELGILPASILPLYRHLAQQPEVRLTVPSVNARTLAYDTAQAMFLAVQEHEVGAFQFELARSEMGYTDQRPGEYSTVILAAAIKTGYRGPVCIVGDHYQVKPKKYAADADVEITTIQDLMSESIAGGFYNIDIDASTMVDLAKPTTVEQQRLNAELTARFVRHIRAESPAGVTVNIGAEIGEVGKTNTTVEELRAFMTVCKEALGEPTPFPDVTKLAVQTGSSHGGVVLPDGSLATVQIDFDAIRNLAKVARGEYGMAGVVQHGASTLPTKLFDKFPGGGAVEIHLATQFQNMVLDHPDFPAALKQEMTAYIREHHGDERKAGMTDEQFTYKLRKKALGPFKRQLWNLDEQLRADMRERLRQQFSTLVTKLNVRHTRSLVNDVLHPAPVASFYA